MRFDVPIYVKRLNAWQRAQGLLEAHTRDVRFGPAEQSLERRFASGLQPHLRSLHTAALSRELGRALDDGADRETLASMARERLSRNHNVRSLHQQAGYYMTEFYNLGGQVALNTLGLGGRFRVSDGDILAAIDGEVDELVEIGGSRSISDTTADELAVRLTNWRDEDDLEFVDMLPLLSAWMLGRTIIRSGVIAATEGVRMSRWGLLSALFGNGVTGVIHQCEMDVENVCSSGICLAYCGLEFDIGRSILRPFDTIPPDAHIPLHPRCRCWYEPLQDDWIEPAIIWTGFALGLLDGELFG